jgi:transcriptional regulator with XRE-family HTH domain
MCAVRFVLERRGRLGNMSLDVTFRERLIGEFEARRGVNKRYSLRAFAALLKADHATLSQIMRGKRSVPVERIAVWGRILKVAPEESAVYAAVGRIADAISRQKEEQLRHWAAEVLSLLTQPVHREMLRLSRTQGFRADSRWLAERIGVGVDDVNIALSRMLRLGLLEIKSAGAWTDTTGLGEITVHSFRKYVAERMSSPRAA